MNLTTQEVAKLLEECNIKEFLKQEKEEAKDFNYKDTNWYAMVKYHESVETCPYSVEDMEEKCFHKDFLD